MIICPQIREKRKRRLRSPPTQDENYFKIILRLKTGDKIARHFWPDALSQVN